MPRTATSSAAERLTRKTCTVVDCQCGGRSFETTHDLRRHLAKGIKAHACTFEGCDKKFVQKGALTIHMQKHTGQRLSSCPFCDMTHYDAARVTKHMQAQHRQHLFQCRMASDNDAPCWYKGGRDLNRFLAHMKRCHQGEEYAALMIAPVVTFDPSSMLSSSYELASSVSPATSSVTATSSSSLGSFASTSGSPAPLTPSDFALGEFEVPVIQPLDPMNPWSLPAFYPIADGAHLPSLFPEIDPVLLNSSWMPLFESNSQPLSSPLKDAEYDAATRQFWDIPLNFNI